MIFYSISNNKSLTADKEFNDKIGVSIDSEDIYVIIQTLHKKQQNILVNYIIRQSRWQSS